MKKFLRKSRYLSWFFIPILISGSILITAFSIQIPQDNPLPDTNAEKMLTSITETKSSEKWDTWPEKEGVVTPGYKAGMINTDADDWLWINLKN